MTLRWSASTRTYTMRGGSLQVSWFFLPLAVIPQTKPKLIITSGVKIIFNGLKGCLQLPKRTFDRRCGDGPAMKEITNKRLLFGEIPENKCLPDGICNETLCTRDPDSWSFTTTGIRYSEKCGHKIVQSGTSIKRRTDKAPSYN